MFSHFKHTTYASPRLVRGAPLLRALVLIGCLCTQQVVWGAPTDGVQFQCESAALQMVKQQTIRYLTQLHIAPDAYVIDQDTNHVTFTLATPPSDTDTLTLASRKELGITDETVWLPGPSGRQQPVSTVSKKEIVLALLQHGRLTQFAGPACTVNALKDHVGVRQNIAAWAEKLEWGWPDGDAARWNTRYWERGTPKSPQVLAAALQDAFLHQTSYSIGCYTASKLVITHAIVDYYRRVKHNPRLATQIEQRLWADRDPLVGTEPGAMWYFDDTYTAEEKQRPGKLLHLVKQAAPRNVVPGDWLYLLNTDQQTYQKTGYEGSNAIYLGRNKFDDYYNDHRHSYTFTEKIDEVYQWRNGVFSRSRDADKIEPLSSEKLDHLTKTPEHGGLLLSYRAVPYLFGYTELPPVSAPINAPLQTASRIPPDKL